jgi:hypothetical protein
MNYSNRENCIHLYFGEATVSTNGTGRTIPMWQILGMTPHTDDTGKERFYLQAKSPDQTNDAENIMFTLNAGVSKKTAMAELCKIMHGKSNNKNNFVNVFDLESNTGANPFMNLVYGITVT